MPMSNAVQRCCSWAFFVSSKPNMLQMEEIVKKLESWGINGVENYIVVMFVCSLFILLASFIDMWSGIDAAKANKEHIDSKGLRRTVNKAIDYFRVLLFGAMIDALGLFFSWYVAPYAMILVTVGIIVIEGRSVIENARKKKSHAAEIVNIIKQIVECADEKDAEKLIGLIKKD